MYSPVVWLVISWESEWIVTFFTTKSFAIQRPASRVSYSTSLLDALNPRIIACLSIEPFGVTRTTPTPEPLYLDTLSTCKCQKSPLGEVGPAKVCLVTFGASLGRFVVSPRLSVNSVMKFAKV
ncbi:hypothetical protein EV2_006992 [Malus domestica]